MLASGGIAVGAADVELVLEGSNVSELDVDGVGHDLYAHVSMCMYMSVSTSMCVCGTFSCTKAASRPVLECLRYEHEQGDQGCSSKSCIRIWQKDASATYLRSMISCWFTHWILCRDVDAVGS